MSLPTIQHIASPPYQQLVDDVRSALSADARYGLTEAVGRKPAGIERPGWFYRKSRTRRPPPPALQHGILLAIGRFGEKLSRGS